MWKIVDVTHIQDEQKLTKAITTTTVRFHKNAVRPKKKIMFSTFCIPFVLFFEDPKRACMHLRRG